MLVHLLDFPRGDGAANHQHGPAEGEFGGTSGGLERERCHRSGNDQPAKAEESTAYPQIADECVHVFPVAVHALNAPQGSRPSDEREAASSGHTTLLIAFRAKRRMIVSKLGRSGHRDHSAARRNQTRIVGAPIVSKALLTGITLTGIETM
jgi:hypothetical protein